MTGNGPDPFDPRLILLHGALDEPVAGELAVRLMTLDAIGDEPISLYIDSADGPLNAALTVIDTIDLLGVPVHGTGVGRVEGAVLGVLAACELRRASPNARLRLTAPREVFATAWKPASNHRISRGAMAMMGTVWKKTVYG